MIKYVSFDSMVELWSTVMQIGRFSFNLQGTCTNRIFHTRSLSVVGFLEHRLVSHFKAMCSKSLLSVRRVTVVLVGLNMNVAV